MRGNTSRRAITPSRNRTRSASRVQGGEKTFTELDDLGRILDQPFRFPRYSDAVYCQMDGVRVATRDINLIELQCASVCLLELPVAVLAPPANPPQSVPDDRPHSLEERFDCFFGGLLRGEARPIIKCPLYITAGMLQLPWPDHPICTAFHACVPRLLPTPDNLMTFSIVRPWQGDSQGCFTPGIAGWVCQPIAECLY